MDDSMWKSQHGRKLWPVTPAKVGWVDTFAPVYTRGDNDPESAKYHVWSHRRYSLHL